MEPVKLAVVGAGLIGSKHARLVHGQPECSLVGICDPDVGRREVAEGLEVPFYRDLSDLLERAAARGGHCRHAQRNPPGRGRGLRREGRRPADREAHCRHSARRPEHRGGGRCSRLPDPGGPPPASQSADSGSALPGSRRGAGEADCGLDDVDPAEAGGIFPGRLA